MTPEDKKNLLKKITTGCAGMRSSLFGNGFTEEETKEALKSAEWLVNELKIRTNGTGKKNLRLQGVRRK